jgi:hypothetical protein
MPTASRCDKASPAPPDHRRKNLAATPSQIAAGSSVREMNDEFVPALSRDRLGYPFGDFSGGIVAKLLPVVVAHNPVAELSSGTT